MVHGTFQSQVPYHGSFFCGSEEPCSGNLKPTDDMAVSVQGSGKRVDRMPRCCQFDVRHKTVISVSRYFPQSVLVINLYCVAQQAFIYLFCRLQNIVIGNLFLLLCSQGIVSCTGCVNGIAAFLSYLSDGIDELYNMLYSLCLIWLFRLISLIMLVQKAYGIGCALILNFELCRSLLAEHAVQSGFQISGNAKGAVVRCAVIIIAAFPDAVKIQIQAPIIQSIHVLQSYAVFRIALKRAVVFRCPVQKRYFNQPAFIRIPGLVGLLTAIQIIFLQPE